MTYYLWEENKPHC